MGMRHDYSYRNIFWSYPPRQDVCFHGQKILLLNPLRLDVFDNARLRKFPTTIFALSDSY